MTTSTSTADRTGLRADIQGLRAIAILLVLLDHAGVAAFHGGFVGVDIFFVISGFLITGHLTREHASTGRVRFAAFYARRARRLLPASLTVIAVTVAASVAFVSPLRLPQIFSDGIASALYVPNIALAVQGTDYLAGTAPSPFQHYWSLGVEEQFYLLWPILIVAALAMRRWVPVAVLVGGVAAASFVCGLIVTSYSQPLGFFLLPTRGWELAIGGLLALAQPRLAALPRRVATIVGWVGLGLLITSAVVFSSETPWPGFATLLPVVAAAAVIGSGVAAGARGPVALLGVRPLVWVGTISYSLYLVHWPILVVVHEAVGLQNPVPVVAKVALVIAAVPLAWVLWRFVENRFRRGKASTAVVGGARGHRAELVTAVAASVVVALSLVGLQPLAASARLDTGRVVTSTAAGTLLPGGTAFVPSNLTPSLRTATDDTGELYTDGCQQSLHQSAVLTCTFGDPESDVTVALYGDSHAGRWFPALKLVAERSHVRLVTYVKSGCRSVELTKNWAASSNATCDAWRAAVVETLNATPPDVILLTNHIGVPAAGAEKRFAADWTDGITTSLSRLPAASRVVSLADTPDFASDPDACLATHVTDALLCAQPRAAVLSEELDTAQREVAAQLGRDYVNLSDYFCGVDTCWPIIGSTLVYSDEHHITAHFSEALAPALQKALHPYFAATD